MYSQPQQFHRAAERTCLQDLVTTNCTINIILFSPLRPARATIGAVIGSGAGSSVLTGPMCSKNFVHWTYDTYAWGTSIGKAMTEDGGKSWFFITADYAFGKDLEKACSDAVTAAGGVVLEAARHPLNTSDFSSLLLQAQASGAQVIGLLMLA